MLNLLDPVELEGLVVFRDDENPSKFYLLPDQPVIPANPQGVPEFLFIKYLRDPADVAAGQARGGGYVQFRTVLSISPDRRDRVVVALRARLAAEQAAGTTPFGKTITSTEPELAAPIWLDGTVTLATFAVADTGLVRAATGSAPIDLAGDLGASARLELDPDGAEIFWSAFQAHRTTQIPILITYQMTYSARVSAGLEIHAKHQVLHRRIWEQAGAFRLAKEPFVRYVPVPDDAPFSPQRFALLRTRFVEPLKALIARPRIEEAVSQTVTNNEVQVIIRTDQAGGGADADKVRDLLFGMATSILTDRVMPLLFDDATPRPAASSDASTSSDFDGVELRTDSPDGDATFDLTLTSLSTVRRTVNPNGPLEFLEADEALLATCFRELRLSDGFFATMRLTVTTAGVVFARDGIATIQVWIRYSQVDDVNPDHPTVDYSSDATLTSESAALNFEFDLARAAGGGHKVGYEYRTQVIYADATSSPPSAWLADDSYTLLLTPRAMGAMRATFILTAPSTMIDDARVELRYDTPSGQQESSFGLTPAAPSHSWLQSTGRPVDLAAAAPTFEYRARFRAGGAEIVGDWQRTGDDTIEIASPFARVLSFVVRPTGSFDGVAHISGDLVYDDPGHGYRVVRSFQLKDLTASAAIDIAVLEGGPETVTWTARINRVDGSSIPVDPGSGGPGTIWVGAQINFLEVQVVTDLVDFNRDVQLAIVQLRYQDAANGLDETTTYTFSAAKHASVTWRVARKDASLSAYDLDVRYIAYDRSKNAEVHQHGATDTVVVLDRGAAGPSG